MAFLIQAYIYLNLSGLTMFGMFNPMSAVTSKSFSVSNSRLLAIKSLVMRFLSTIVFDFQTL